MALDHGTLTGMARYENRNMLDVSSRLRCMRHVGDSRMAGFEVFTKSAKRVIHLRSDPAQARTTAEIEAMLTATVEFFIREKVLPLSFPLPPIRTSARLALRGNSQSSTCPEQPPSDSAVKVEATQEHDLDGRSHNGAAGR